MKSTELKKITIRSFKGIDPSNPVVIDFSGSDKNIVRFTGDQGRGKTSAIEAVRWLMGAAFGVSISELFHNGEPIDEDMEFTHAGKEYKAIATGDKLVVKSLREGDKKDTWVNEASPKGLLQAIFKQCFVDEKLRNKKPQEQVEWVAELFPIPKDDKEVIVQCEKLIENLKTNVRPAISKEVAKYKTMVEMNPLNAEYIEKGEALEKEIKKLDKAQEKLDVKDVSERFQKYQSAEAGLKTLQESYDRQANDLKELERQLAELNKKIQEKTTEISNTRNRVVDGEKYIADNKKVVTEYDKAMKLQAESADITLRISNFEALKENMEKYNAESDKYTDVDSRIKEIISDIKGVKAKYIPEIEGVEIVTVQEMEDGEITKEVGIYYNGVNLRTLSGSEYIATLIKIIRASGSRFVMIDDLATYGSDTIAYVNQLAKDIEADGGVVFASEMERGGELIINMEDEIK